MTNSQNSNPGSAASESRSTLQSSPNRQSDLGTKTGKAVSKLTEAAQQAGTEAKRTATLLASEAVEKANGLMNQQLGAGADLVGHIAHSVRAAADSLGPKAPQLAGRFAQRPPIASMLVGAGLMSLMRTNPQDATTGAAIISRAGDLAVAAKEKVEQWSSEAGETLSRSELAGSVKETVQQWSSDAGETISQFAGTAKSAASMAHKIISLTVAFFCFSSTAVFAQPKLVDQQTKDNPSGSVMQPQGMTGPIITKSGGAPASSPQGETPAGMQAAPKGSGETIRTDKYGIAEGTPKN